MGRLMRMIPALALVAFACSPGQPDRGDSAAPPAGATAADTAVPLPAAGPAAPLDTTPAPPPVVRSPGAAPGRAARRPPPPAAVTPSPSAPDSGRKFGPKDGLHIDPARPPRDPSLPRPPMLSAQRYSPLESEARKLASTTGCARASQCRTAPLGAKACGGPRAYLVYCPFSTDTVALFRKLGELERAEQEYNRRSGMASTCEFLTPPATGVVGGRCAAIEANTP